MHRTIRVAAVLLLMLGPAACSFSSRNHADPTTAARALHTSTRTTLSGAQLHYGASVRRAAGVVYQPDVVLIGGGADAVRSVSANGLLWTIDATAPGAAELRVGKIMAVTSLGTGRVLKLARAGGNDHVLLGPVILTDIIRDANLRSSAPIALTHPLYYATPGAPGAQTTDRRTPDAPDSARERALRSVPTIPPVPHLTTPSPLPTPPPLPVSLPVPTTMPQVLSSGEAVSRPFLTARGLGAEVSVQHGDGRFDASMTLHLDAPTADFVLHIEDGTVKEASVRLHGAGAIDISVTAAQQDSTGDFADKQIQIPLTLAIPLGGPAPLYLSITQGFLVTSQIAGAGSVQTHGSYRLVGDLYFGIRNGRPLLSATTAAVAVPMDRNTLSLGVAGNAVELGWRVTAEVGVGLLGFSAGAWYKLGFATKFVADTGLDVLHPGCVTNSVILRGQFGIGYHVPAVVMRAVNFFLGVFGVKKIPADGGIKSRYVPLWQPPSARYCPGYNH